MGRRTPRIHKHRPMYGMDSLPGQWTICRIAVHIDMTTSDWEQVTCHSCLRSIQAQRDGIKFRVEK